MFRCHYKIFCLVLLVLWILDGKAKGIMTKFPSRASDTTEIRISTFDIDATPPVGSQLAYDLMVNTWDLGLRAKGIVILGSGKPIVLCAVDWLGIANEGQDAFKAALADAVKTAPDRIAVHTLHQHDAPICDFSAEQILKSNNISPQSFDGTFQRELIQKLKIAVRNSLLVSQTVTHFSIGKAPVHKVASNRRIIGDNGKVIASRYSSCTDSLLKAKPEGIIDSLVSIIGFWNGKKPIAVLSFYACHPQSYYLTQVANPDFVGLARFYRQLEVPDAIHVHFNGAGGNVTAGKYNDGSHEQRAILADRLANGMKQAWNQSTLIPLNSNEVDWFVEKVSIKPANGIEQIEKLMKTENSRYFTNNIPKLAWMKRTLEGQKITLACLKIGNARLLFMPGELFVEYQLAAQSLHPELFVSMAAYGDYGPFYIGTEESYSQGGYEIQVSPVTEDAESVIKTAIDRLLSQ